MDARELFSFPNPVNEKAARTVAAGVVVMAVATLATQQLWFTAVLAAGFLARVLTGPTLSPLGQLATRVVAPRLGAPKPVPGPPKRFAQGMGFVMTTAAALVWFTTGSALVTSLLLAALVVAAVLESVFAVCLGCHAFALLMRVGVVPESVCRECADVRGRLEQLAPTG
ncbi:DUF4395 domain-containing protein [Jatrophihabitans sp. YIM 134969]